MNSIHRARAEQLLARLRECPENFRENYSALAGVLHDGDVPPEDIGTTKEELVEILENCQKEWGRFDALYWLNELRENPSSFDPVISLLGKEMAKAGMKTYEDLGTSAEEIEELRQEGIQIRIEKLLTEMRSRDADERSDIVIALRRLLGLGRLSAEEAGTSEEELDRALGVIHSSEH